MKENILYKIARPFLKMYINQKYKLKIFNKPKIPTKEGIILAGNHTNNYDFMCIAASSNHSVRFIAKSELFKGINKYILKGAGLIPVNRKIHDKTVIPSAVKSLKKGQIIAIFPEGTISKTNSLLPFKKGAVKMSLESNCKIIPFAINGKYEKNKLKIKFGEAYFPKTTDIEKETNILKEKVESLLKEV